MNPIIARDGLFAFHAKVPTATSTAKSAAVLITTSSNDIGAEVGRLSIALRSRLPTSSGLIRAKPRPVRTGLELRINFSLYMYGERALRARDNVRQNENISTFT